ncbi:MAG: hypothetical protein ACPGOY_15860 [Rhodospirillaceae bacterium]
MGFFDFYAMQHGFASSWQANQPVDLGALVRIDSQKADRQTQVILLFSWVFWLISRAREAVMASLLKTL